MRESAQKNRNIAVFLDRDGVVNKAIIRQGLPYPPHDLADLQLNDGALANLPLLKQAGFKLIVVTNQPDVARGIQTRECVEAMNCWLRERLPLDEFRVCYHDEIDRCACRKPEPGLILDAAREHVLDLSNSYLIGDRWKDIEAAARAGCHPIFLDYGYSERRPTAPCHIVSSLDEACQWILQSLSTSPK